MRIRELLSLPSLWETLQQSDRPIVLYGMGDGADKLLAACHRFSIPVSGVFASNGFVRGHSFRGFPVRTLGELESELGEMIVLLAFATSHPEVLALIDGVAARHTVYAPDLPVCGNTLFTRDYLESHLEDAQRALELLAGHRSREVYLDILRYRLTGEIRYLYRCQSPRAEVWQCLLPLGEEEFFVDAGAYRGDTVEEFIEVTGGRYRGILALEPDRRNHKKLLETVSRLKLPHTRCVMAGAWKKEDTLPFGHKSGRQASLGETGTPTPVNSIDNLLEGREATLIKYDVEGAETPALLGTRQTIAACHPRLVVSAYHRTEDLFDLPPLIKRLGPDYQIHLRHHPYIPAWDTNYYCIRP